MKINLWKKSVLVFLSGLLFGISSGLETSDIKSGQTFAGINFYERDGFNIPDYTLSRNLIQNPGFEAGFRYWHHFTCGEAELNVTDYALIDESTSFRGKRSLKLTIRKEQAPPNDI